MGPYDAEFRRRWFVVGSLTVGTALLAGCLEDTTDEKPAEETDDGTDREPTVPVGDRGLDEIHPITLREPETGEMIAELHGLDGHWHFTPWNVPLEEPVSAELTVLDTETEPIALGESEPYRLDATVPEGDGPARLEVDVSDDVVDVRGEATGQTTVVFELVSDDEVLYTTPPLEVAVDE